MRKNPSISKVFREIGLADELGSGMRNTYKYTQLYSGENPIFNVSGHLLAASIYGPSYISFEYALSYHGLIPEAVYTVTCATFEKKKKRQYDTSFGIFTYRDVPSEAFPLYIELRNEGDYWYRIASPEKALCDQLYILRPVKNTKELAALLFDDLRIEETELQKTEFFSCARKRNQIFWT